MATKIAKVAIKKPSGKVASEPMGLKHKDLHTSGKRGFVTDSGKFVGRTEGAKIANKAKQSKTPVSRLHSEDLKAYKPRSKSK